MLVLVLVLGPVAVPFSKVFAAACTAPSTDYGTATNTITVPGTATYRLWTRMYVPDATNKTYLLEVDGAQCFTVGGGTITPATWTWVDYHSATINSKVQLSLSQGNHSLKLIGKAPGVKIDRVVAVSDLNCVPNGFGDNCDAPDDTTPPSVTLTSPTEDATLTGTANITATATDDVGVKKVEFYDNSSLLGTDTASPYEMTWDTVSVPNGTHLVTARAYDAANNVSSDSNTVTTMNGDAEPPTQPTNVKGTAVSYSSIKLTWSASTDNVGVKEYNVIRDGVPVAVISGTEYADGNLAANTSYEYKIVAIDAAGNTSATSSAVTVKTLEVGDTEPPTQPTRLNATAPSPTQVNLSWTASGDNTGVVAYDVYRSKNNGVASKVGTTTTTSFGDASVSPRTNYTYYVVARDGAGNSSPASDKVTIKTPEVIRRKVRLTGTITNTKTKKAVSYSRATITVGKSRYIYQADRRGRYAINSLNPGLYNITHSARGYKSTALSVNVTDSMTQNVKLEKR
ncbi:MAG TPA: Ig-like domain-containing protein [Candidatus Saccharimonadales bacterium]|nr:Ig-like domain-containing protein [Candidatus Saccharimonadales bacterium]